MSRKGTRPPPSSVKSYGWPACRALSASPAANAAKTSLLWSLSRACPLATLWLLFDCTFAALSRRSWDEPTKMRHKRNPLVGSHGSQRSALQTTVRYPHTTHPPPCTHSMSGDTAFQQRTKKANVLIARSRLDSVTSIANINSLRRAANSAHRYQTPSRNVHSTIRDSKALERAIL